MKIPVGKKSRKLNLQRQPLSTNEATPTIPATEPDDNSDSSGCPSRSHRRKPPWDSAPRGEGIKEEALDLQGLPSGGDSWTRTNDPIDVNDVLYRLSHATTFAYLRPTSPVGHLEQFVLAMWSSLQQNYEAVFKPLKPLI